MTHASRAYLSLAGAGCLWGTGFLLGKFLLVELDVPHMMMYRLLLACVGFVPVLFSRRPRVRAEDWRMVVIAGVFGVPLVYLIQFEGLARTTVAHASLMVAMFPILLGVAAAALAGERVPMTRWMLLVVSAIGALLIVSSSAANGDDRGPTAIGDGLVLLSLFAGVAWVMTSKRLMSRYDPIGIAALITVVGTIPLVVWVLTVNGPPPLHLTWRAWLPLIAQGLFATTVANLLWNWGVSRVPMSEAGVFVNLEPVVGTLLGMIVLGDRLGWSGVAGALLIIGAAVGVTRQG
ncbi:MAG TPA: EamA family transporter [Vicinamibacterales bacterium]|jgi:drug/metabolite transporter (DMT)-like permease